MHHTLHLIMDPFSNSFPYNIILLHQIRPVKQNKHGKNHDIGRIAQSSTDKRGFQLGILHTGHEAIIEVPLEPSLSVLLNALIE
jgi:hypothetical protein